MKETIMLIRDDDNVDHMKRYMKWESNYIIGAFDKRRVTGIIVIARNKSQCDAIFKWFQFK
jgi:hypothetical protein